MRATDQIEEVFKALRSINYENKEGGRYAYVQLMAYTRDLKNLLMTFHSLVKNEIKELENMHEQLNELVPLKFDRIHRDVFEQHMKKLEEISKTLQIILSGDNKAQSIAQPVKLVA